MKLSLDRITSSFGFQAAFNSVLESIEQEFSEKVLYRDNPESTNNVMKNDIDMGEHDLLNVGRVSATDFTINGVDVTQSLEEALLAVAAYPDEAKGYRDEAAGYAASASGEVALCEAQVALAAGHASDASDFADAAESAATNAASDVATLLSGYVTDAEDFADDAEQAALDAAAAVSGLDARVDQLEIDLPALETVVGDKLDKDENINLGVSVAASGNLAALFEGFPSGVKRVTMMLDGVSTSGTSNYVMCLLNSSGYVTSGYKGATYAVLAGTQGGAVHGSNFNLTISTGYTVASALYSGKIEFIKIKDHVWAMSGSLSRNDVAWVYVFSGSVDISTELTGIQIGPANETDTFDAGTINISWEF